MRLACAGVRSSALRIVLAVLLAAALVPAATPRAPASAGRGALTVAVVPGIDNAPLRVAVQEGLFRQHGLDVTVRDYLSIGAEFQALTSGQVRSRRRLHAFFYEQATAKAPLRLIADGYDAVADSMAILTLPSSGITTPQQLKGQPGGVATLPAQLVP